MNSQWSDLSLLTVYTVLFALQSLDGLGEEEEMSELQQQTVFLQQFWEEINHSVKATPSGSMLRDMARLDLEVTQVGVPDNSEEKVCNEGEKGVFTFQAVFYDKYSPILRLDMGSHCLTLLPTVSTSCWSSGSSTSTTSATWTFSPSH